MTAASWSSDELKTLVLENLVIVGLPQRELEKFLIRLKNDHAHGRFQPLSQNLSRLTQAPAEVRNDVRLFYRMGPIKFLYFPLWVVRAVIWDSIHFHVDLAGPGCDGTEPFGRHKERNKGKSSADVPDIGRSSARYTAEREGPDRC